MERESEVWPAAVLLGAGWLCGCAGVFGPRKPLPAAQTVALEADGAGPDARSAEAAARRAALLEGLELFLSSADAARHPGLPEEGARYVAESRVVGSSHRRGVWRRRVSVTMRYRDWGKALEAQGFVAPPAIAGRPCLSLRVETGPARAALARRLSVAGFGVDCPGVVLELAGREVEALAPAASGRLAARTESLELTARWLSTGTPQVPFSFSRSATAFELSPSDAQTKAADDAAWMAARDLRAWAAQRLEMRRRMTILALSAGDLDRVRALLAALRAQPGVVAASLEGVAGSDARLRVWTEKLSADELALRLKELPGFHFAVRNVEPPYGWVEIDGEDSD